MCLTGVDYFSTLGYQPGLAVVAAGALAPIATLVLIAVTLLCAVPVYRTIARLSPHGQGSISLLAKQLHGWRGKIIVLVLLGFAFTDFIITITLSSADAAAHILHSTHSPWILPVTLGLLVSLMAVFFRGFREAIVISVVLVVTYMGLNAVILTRGLWEVITHPELIPLWRQHLVMTHPNIWVMIGVAVIIFPKLALGLSGFETGVSVIPQINGGRQGLAGQIRRGRYLLTTAAVIMSVSLIASSIVVSLLVPAAALEPGQPADGRALAYLAHLLFGDTLGRIYDYTTVAILWFAGASAMAGLLNLIPRFLPDYGMAPEWSRRTRPLVLVLGVLSLAVTLVFGASVEAQAGAYATGVLVLLTSGSVAVMLHARRHQQRWRFGGFSVTSAVFGYTLITNIIERPEGIKVASVFILLILTVSFASRALRAYELRTPALVTDAAADRIIAAAGTGNRIFLIAHSALHRSAEDYERKEAAVRQRNFLPAAEPVVFVEVHVRDSSEFHTPVRISGCTANGLPVLRLEAVAISSAMASLALYIRDTTEVVPDLFFDWAPGNPLLHMLRFLFLGRGQNATTTQEILRRTVAEPEHRPRVHVG